MTLTRSARSRRPGTLQGIVLLLPITLAVMGIVVLVPIVPLLMQQFGGTPHVQYWVLGGVMTLPALCVALFAPVAGWLTDRFGRRRILLLAMILYALLGVSPCLLDGLPAIVASRAGVGLCEAVILTASTTMISDYFEGPARERWLANQTAVASVSSLTLIAIGGVLGGMFGWRGPFGLYLLALLVAAAIWRFTWEPEARSPPTGGLPQGAQAATSPASASHVPLARLSGICAITVFASIMFYTIPTQCSLALIGLGVNDAPTLGLLTAIACLGVPLGTVMFRICVRLGVHAQLSIAFLIMGTGFIGMANASHWETFIPAAAVNQVGCGMILPTLLTWATRGLAFEVRGKGMGMWQSSFALGQFLSGLVVPLIAERAGGLQPGLLVLGFANAALMGIALLWATARRSPAPVTPGLP